MAGKGGGAWKVAYADFVTAMMAFFMVMWLLAQDDKVKSAVAEHFRNPDSRYAPGDSLMEPKHPQFFKDRRTPAIPGEAPVPPGESDQPAAKPHTVHLVHGDRALIGTAVFFEGNATGLSEEAQERLRRFAPLAQGKPQKIELRGHAARSGIRGTDFDDLWQLSYARCVATREFLESLGIPAAQFRLSQAGMFEPYSISDVPERTARNSRVDVFLLNELAEESVGTPAERAERFRTPAAAP